jgi:excisionase family DNA binding protein
MQETEQWLSLSQAAHELGVHITTLRRWANNGDIPCLLTPGGHRRFAARDVTQFAQQRRSLNPNELSAAWASNALIHTRQEIGEHPDQSWLVPVDDATRDRYRLLGRQLLGLTMQYLSDENGGAILAEAASLGRQYAEMAFQNGLPLSKALEASMFFRDMLMETALQLPESAHIRPDANVRLLRRVSALLNSVQLAIAEVYDAGTANSLSRD